MKTALALSCLFLAAGAAGHAQAADTSSPWDMSKNYNWQGVFVGVNAGVGWGNDKSTESVANGGGDTGFSADFDQRGGVEGFQAGYNVPLGQNLIFGADADWDNYDVSGGYRRISGGNGDDVKYNWMASLRARVGMPFDNFLPYIDGGAVMSEIKDDFIAGNTAAQDMSNIRFGWSVGAGLEVGLPENFAARIDYRYTEFASDRKSVV